MIANMKNKTMKTGNKRRIAMTGITNWVETKQPRLKGSFIHPQPSPGWRYITVQSFLLLFFFQKEKVGKGMKCGFWNYLQSFNNRKRGQEGGDPRNWQYSESLASPIAGGFFLDFCFPPQPPA